MLARFLSARSVIAAVIKRLQHRNPNVQLYSLALVEALSKNCGLEVHREIASRSFTQALERLVTDRVSPSINHSNSFPDDGRDTSNRPRMTKSSENLFLS